MSVEAPTDFDQLMNQARVKLIGASDAGIKGELFDVMHEFFVDTSWWTESIPITIRLPDPALYQITPVSGGRIIRLAGVVDPNNISQPAILGDDMASVQFAHAYNTAQVMTAVVVKTVALPTDRKHFPVLPDGLLPRWHTVILAGLLGAMSGQLGKSYSNETSATYQLRRFNNGKAQARIEKLRRNTFGTQAWQFPPGFAGGSQRGGTSLGNDLSFKV